jgi:hypothetical protein
VFTTAFPETENVAVEVAVEEAERERTREIDEEVSPIVVVAVENWMVGRMLFTMTVVEAVELLFEVS